MISPPTGHSGIVLALCFSLCLWLTSLCPMAPVPYRDSRHRQLLITPLCPPSPFVVVKTGFKTNDALTIEAGSKPLYEVPDRFHIGASCLSRQTTSPQTLRRQIQRLKQQEKHPMLLT